MSNLEYEKENRYLPPSIRLMLQETAHQSTQVLDEYLNLFTGQEYQAIMNNIQACEFGRGFTRLNYVNLSSGAAPRLAQIKTNKTVGRVNYYCNDDNAKELLNKLGAQYFSKKLYEACYQANMTGRSLMVLYTKENSDKYYVNCYNMFRHKIQKDSYGNIIDAKMFINKLDAEKATEKYFIVEHRYYKEVKDGDKSIRKAYQEFKICKSMTSDLSKKGESQNVYLETKNIPDSIKAAFKDVAFNSKQELLGDDIGVFRIDGSSVNMKYPDLDVPETMFNNAIDAIANLDQTLTHEKVEQFVGRGQVLIPSFGKASQTINVAGGASNVASRDIWLGSQTSTLSKTPWFTQIPTHSMEDNKPQNVQFDIRTDQWENAINGDTGRLCAIVGISIMDYDPRLLMTGQRTDDEINAMTDITADTITTFRKLNEDEINKLLTLVGLIMGIEVPITIQWSMETIMNPTKNAAYIEGLLTNSLISRKTALKKVHPDMSEREIEEELKLIQQETSAKDVNATFDNF